MRDMPGPGDAATWGPVTSPRDPRWSWPDDDETEDTVGAVDVDGYTYNIVSLHAEPAPYVCFEVQQVIETGEDTVDVIPVGSGWVRTTLAEAMAVRGFRLGDRIESGAGAYEWTVEPEERGGR